MSLLCGLRHLRGKCNLFSSKVLLKKGQTPVSNYSSATAVKRVKDPHMNDIPLPIPYEEVNGKRQREYNIVLITGIIFFLFSSSFVINSGVIVPNLTPPRKNPE